MKRPRGIDAGAAAAFEGFVFAIAGSALLAQLGVWIWRGVRAVWAALS